MAEEEQLEQDGRHQLSTSAEHRVARSLARQGFLAGMSARLVEVGQGRCVIELPFRDSVAQQHGLFHGGAIGALADTAGGYAAMTMVPDQADVLTLEYKINFLRPASGETLVAEATVLRAGRSLVVTRVDVFAVSGEQRKLCAALQQSVVPAPAAGGAK